MLVRTNNWVKGVGLLGVLCAPAFATVQISSLTPALAAPQPLGTPILWTATATDSNPGPLTFQFNVAAPRASFALAHDFNVGVLSGTTWTSPAFWWMPTFAEGNYQVQVIVKDFVSGETATLTVAFQVTSLVSGSLPVVTPTWNALVALFSTPSCPAGSTVRVVFQQQSKKTPATMTNWGNCHPPTSVNFEIAGLYPNGKYVMYAQTNTGGHLVNGPTVTYTVPPLPTDVPFTWPTFTLTVNAGPNTDTSDSVILHQLTNFGGASSQFPDVATDLAGHIVWYYYDKNQITHSDLLTRAVPGGYMLMIQDSVAWNPAAGHGQYLREMDLVGNVIKETNTGIIQQQLLAMGSANGGPCTAFPNPTVGSACLSGFHHEAIHLPNGYTAVIAAVEKIFPPGTQGDTSGLPVDIIGDMFVVLNTNWQVVWYWDAFDHAGGAPELDINRPAVLGETCVANQSGCPAILLLGSGIALKAHDWLHANSLYYSPSDGNIIWSSRHQDWIAKIDYNNGLQTGGLGTGKVLWRMGPGGDFTFLNNFNDPWPWFSHQHDAGIEHNGAGPLTVFDNGNTRISAAPIGLGNPGCQPADCNSRGMALTVDETNRLVTPVLSVDMGVYSSSMGSEQLLPNGNYFVVPADVVVSLSNAYGYSVQIYPTPGTVTGTQVYNLQGPGHYRAWQMPNLYSPPGT